MRDGAPATSSGTSRFTSTKWPRWLVPNCVSKPSAVVPLRRGHHPGVGDQQVEPVVVGEHAVGEAAAPRRATRGRPPAARPGPAVAAARTGSAARSPFSRSRTAMITFAPWAARARAVSWPSPADAPVTRACFPLRSTPSSTSSVVVCSPKVMAGHRTPAPTAAPRRSRQTAADASNRPTCPPIDDWSRLLDGRVAVVSGGGDGIGGAVSRLFAQHGAIVEVAEVDAERAECGGRRHRGGRRAPRTPR